MRSSGLINLGKRVYENLIVNLLVLYLKYSLEFNIEALIFLFHDEMAHRWRGVAFIINCLKARMWIDSLKWKSGAIRLN